MCNFNINLSNILPTGSIGAITIRQPELFNPFPQFSTGYVIDPRAKFVSSAAISSPLGPIPFNPFDPLHTSISD